MGTTKLRNTFQKCFKDHILLIIITFLVPLSEQIRKAWDISKTTKQNMQDMGLTFGTKGVLPVTSKVRFLIPHNIYIYMYMYILYFNIVHIWILMILLLPAGQRRTCEASHKTLRSQRFDI